MRTDVSCPSATPITNPASRIAALEREVQLRDQFVTVAVQELRGPLTPIALELDTLLAHLGDRARSPREQASLERLQRNMRRFLARTSLLLSTAHIQQGHLRLSLTPTRLRSLIDHLLSTQSLLCKQVGADILLHMPADPWVQCDAVAVEQILDGLLSNALRYGMGPIEVDARACKDHFQIRVKDHGPGVAPAAQSTLFELFGGRNTTCTSGFGMTLWTGRRLAQAMEGDLTLEDSSANGATFLLTLPLASEKSLAA